MNNKSMIPCLLRINTCGNSNNHAAVIMPAAAITHATVIMYAATTGADLGFTEGGR